MKRISIILLCVFVTVFVVACSDDEDVFTPKPDSPFKNLTARDDVLHNLELAYNQRNIIQFNRLLDHEFIFYFSQAAHGSGSIPNSWGRLEEISVTTNMFNPNLRGRMRVVNIDLQLTKIEDDWTEIPQVDEDSWYSMEVVYSITVQTASGVDYTAEDLRAEFTVREAAPMGETEKIWRVIRWRDIGGGTRSPDLTVTNAAARSPLGAASNVYIRELGED